MKIIDETQLQVGDVVQWWEGGALRTVLEMIPWKSRTCEQATQGCKFMAKFTSHSTKSGAVLCSLWEGQTIVLISRKGESV